MAPGVEGMSIADGKDCRNWLKNPEEYMAIKEKRRMLSFQVSVFRRELKREQKTLEKLNSHLQLRIDRWHPRFDSREKLDEAYVAGLVTDRDYMRERYAIWQVYNDRGHNANIAWLSAELEKCETALENLENHIDQRHKDTQRRYRRKIQAHKRKNRLRRKWYAQQRAEGKWWRR